MRTSLLLLLAAACASSRSGQAPAPPAGPGPSVNPTAGASTTAVPSADADRAAPRLRLPETARPVRYRATLTLVPDRDDFDGVIEIDLDVQEQMRVLWLNADDLTVRKAEARVEGKTVAGRVYAQPKDYLGIGFDPQLPTGTATVRIEYAGKLSRRDTGGVLKTQDGGEWYVTTHFEPIDARRAYPCFDEPSYKVPWELALRVKKEHAAFANTPVVSREDGGDGMSTVRFAPTRPLPSYLTAFAAGPFERLDAGKAGKNGTPVGVIVPRGTGDRARYAVQISPQVVPHLEEYFGSPYPFEKLDSIAVPLGRGAMENVGLVTFGAPILLVRPGEETQTFRRSQTSVTTHEFAHMWFGDLVTTAWWDDIWLNEAFATWMTGKALEPWFPQWKIDEQRVSIRNVAMAADALVSARRIRQPIQSNDDMVNAFDAITYQKGASVISMFERLVSPGKFQRGVRRYMKDHAYSNATAKDFLSAVSAEAGMDIEPAFSTFLEQGGVPLVTAQVSCGTSPRVVLAQERYFPLGSEPGPDERKQIWQIPVCVRSGKERFCTVLTSQKGELPISKAACSGGLVPNDGASGYYHAASWDPRMLQNGGKDLLPVERMAALDDLGALARAGRMEYSAILALAPKFAQDPDRGTTKSVIDLVGSLRESGLVSDDQRPAYARYIRDLFGRRAHALGWEPKQAESDETKLLRPELLEVVGDAGEDPQILSGARARAETWLRERRGVDPEVVGTALHLAATRGDQALFDALHGAARAEKDRRARQQLLGALGSFRDPALVKQAFAIALSDEFPIRETIPLVMGATKSPVTRTIAYDFVRSNFDALAARLPRREGGSSLVGAASVLCDDTKRDEIEGFFKERLQKSLGGPRRYTQAMETLRTCSVFKGAQAASVAAFLASRKERLSAGSGGSR
ncbi:MAG: M1 family metallopeptidase [Deltaproteobacteria bacterium]|nr:MAG: M1 family metallopeptidase [Deltaproteobacteria bacterium]